MKLFVMFVLAAALLVGSHVFARTELAEWRQIIEQRCSQCHTPQRIEQAILKGENFDEIIAKMIRLGAKLDSREQDVLGVFWSARQTSAEPLIAEGKTVSGDPLGEYRAVLESRCTGCHTLEPVEAAMLEGRSLDELLELMAQRGLIISSAEKDVLGTFWGTPFKQELPK